VGNSRDLRGGSSATGGPTVLGERIIQRIDISDNIARFPDMTVKQHAIKTIQELPDDVDWEDVKERIEFLSAVEKGLKELDSGQGILVEELEKEIKEWTSK
jgi:hypothetical protein